MSVSVDEITRPCGNAASLAPRWTRSDSVESLGHQGEFSRGLPIELPGRQSPPPVAGVRPGPIHPRVAAEAEKVLHGNDCRIRHRFVEQEAQLQDFALVTCESPHREQKVVPKADGIRLVRLR